MFEQVIATFPILAQAATLVVLLLVAFWFKDFITKSNKALKDDLSGTDKTNRDDLTTTINNINSDVNRKIDEHNVIVDGKTKEINTKVTEVNEKLKTMIDSVKNLNSAIDKSVDEKIEAAIKKSEKTAGSERNRIEVRVETIDTIVQRNRSRLSRMEGLAKMKDGDDDTI